MDMKKILQVIDGAVKRPVVDSSDMKRFVSIVAENNVAETAKLSAQVKQGVGEDRDLGEQRYKFQRIKFRGTDHDIGEERYVFVIDGNPEVFNFASDEDNPNPDSPSFEEILARVQRSGAVAHHRITPAEQQAIAKKIAAERQRYLDQRRSGVAEGFSNDMSTEDMIAYLRQHHDKNLHPDYINHLTTTNSKFVLKKIPLSSIKTELSGLDRAKVEQYKQMDFSKAPPIVVGSDGNILDGYHRATVAKALGIPTIKAYVGIKGQQDVQEGVPQPGKSSGKPISWISPERVITKYLTLNEILNSVQGIPYYNEVVKDRDAKDFSWGVTKKVLEYARELIIHPDAYKSWPPIIVVDGKLQDGAHRISTINLMQKRVQPNNPIWKNAKLKVEFGKSDNVRQGVAEGLSFRDYLSLAEAKKKITASEDPCWKGYKMVGTKKKGGREVPNCVPGKKGD
jgi:hypothetical protein